MALDPRLVTDKERTLFTIGAIWSALIWLLVIVTIIGALYAIPVILFVLMAHALFLAHVRGNGVRISPTQLPDLYARCEAASKQLGLEEVPEVYLLQSGGILNAFATKLLSRKFVIIYSGLVSACEDPRELDFVVGHEIGHLAAGHLRWNAFLMPFHLMPWLGAAYSRAREYTCDRCGFAVVGDLEPSARALVVLAAGGKYAAKVDLAAFATQRLESGTFWMATLELVSTHPFLCKRVAALQEFKTPGSVPAVARTAWAYPLAPLLGIAGGGGSVGGAVLIMVAIVGVMAAIAIPAFMKYTQNARDAAAVFGGSAIPGAGAAAAAPDDDAEQQKQLLQMLQQLQQQAADLKDDSDATTQKPTTPSSKGAPPKHPKH